MLFDKRKLAMFYEADAENWLALSWNAALLTEDAILPHKFGRLLPVRCRRINDRNSIRYRARRFVAKSERRFATYAPRAAQGMKFDARNDIQADRRTPSISKAGKWTRRPRKPNAENCIRSRAFRGVLVLGPTQSKLALNVLSWARAPLCSHMIRVRPNALDPKDHHPPPPPPPPPPLRHVVSSMQPDQWTSGTVLFLGRALRS